MRDASLPALRLDMAHPTNGDRKAIGRRPQRTREDRGVGTVETAKGAGIARQTLFRIESGNSAPSVVTLARLADALGVSMRWLANRSDEEHGDGPDDRGGRLPAWLP